MVGSGGMRVPLSLRVLRALDAIALDPFRRRPQSAWTDWPRGAATETHGIFDVFGRALGFLGSLIEDDLP